MNDLPLQLSPKQVAVEKKRLLRASKKGFFRIFTVPRRGFSIFIPILRNNLLIGYFGLIVFLGLTAYDMQKIKAYYYQADGELKDNLAVYSAFQLYLDFINILLYIIRILGNRNRN